MIVDNQNLKENIKNDKLTIQEMLKTHTPTDVYPYATFSLFSRFVELEQFIINAYINYALGESSIVGFKPEVEINFKNDDTLKIFHKPIDKFITVKIIKETYIHMFGDGASTKNPFSVFYDIEYSKFEQLESIRNVIAHQSEDAYKKFFNKCNSGAPCSLDDYLYKYNGNFANYNKLINFIQDLSEIIVNPI